MKPKHQIFMSYAREDERKVRKLHSRLSDAGFRAWLDTESLLAGVDWKREIRKAIGNSGVVLVCVSANSVTKRGYCQVELREALEVLKEMPEHRVYLIPARLEKCEIPDSLRDLNCIDLFARGGFAHLVDSIREALKRRAAR